jgi:uncharacterized protein YqeY
VLKPKPNKYLNYDEGGGSDPDFHEILTQAYDDIKDGKNMSSSKNIKDLAIKLANVYKQREDNFDQFQEGPRKELLQSIQPNILDVIKYLKALK